VAENLARLGVPTILLGVVGDDLEGHDVLAQTEAAGVDCRVDVRLGATTGRYCAVVAPDGRLVLGAAAMSIHDAMMPAWLAAQATLLDRADWVFADANLPAASLAWLAARPQRLAVDAVSVAKAPRLPARADLLLCNREEAALLCGSDGDTMLLARALTGRAGMAVVSNAAHGVSWADGDAAGHVDAPATLSVDETGAGDALIAGTLYGLLQGVPLAEACRYGVVAAARTVAVVGPCAPLTPTELAGRAA
jgi:pseudouridine kinase